MIFYSAIGSVVVGTIFPLFKILHSETNEEEGAIFGFSDMAIGVITGAVLGNWQANKLSYSIQDASDILYTELNDEIGKVQQEPNKTVFIGEIDNNLTLP
jgi:hypothetical protein